MAEPAAIDGRPRPQWMRLATLAAIAAVGPTALNMPMPSVPGLQVVFATDYGTVQLVLTAFLVAFAVAQLIFGSLSDSFGRRPVVLAGLVLFLAGTMVCTLAPTIEVLIGGRILQAVGGCAGLAMSRAIVRDLYDRDRAASMLGYIAAAMVVPPALAPAAGGYLDAWFGWRASFAVMAALGLAILALTAFTLDETLRGEHQPAQLRNHFGGVVQLFGQRSFCGYVFQIGFSSAVFFAFVGGAPYVVTQLMNRSPSEYGVYFIAVSVAFIAGNLVSGRLSARLGIERMIVRGVSVSLLGSVVLAIVAAVDALDPATLFAITAFIVLGYGLSLPNSLAGAVSVDPRRAGTAAAISGFMQMGVGAVASYVVGILLVDSAMPLIVVMAVASVLAFAGHVLGTAEPAAKAGQPSL